jgi:hypothetical protein
MDSNEMTATAESFSAVVATAIPAGAGGFDPSRSSWCGGGMARVKDD